MQGVFHSTNARTIRLGVYAIIAPSTKAAMLLMMILPPPDSFRLIFHCGSFVSMEPDFLWIKISNTVRQLCREGKNDAPSTGSPRVQGAPGPYGAWRALRRHAECEG